MKIHYILWILGLVLCLGGEILRKLAMITASKNFSHIVSRSNRHQEIIVWQNEFRKNG